MTSLLHIHLGAMKRQAEDEKRYRCHKSRPTTAYYDLLRQIKDVEAMLQQKKAQA